MFNFPKIFKIKAIKELLFNLKGVVELSIQLAKVSFKLRNEGSYLGIFWYLLNPILTFTLLYLIFNDRLGLNIQNYPLYLFVGIIMFNFFQTATIEATKSIILNHKGIIKSINFPKESLILSIVFKNLFSHIFEILFLIFLIFYFKANILGIFFYPFILIFFCMFVFGISLILSSLSVFFVDIENIWTFILRLIWLATPIFYAIEGQTRLFYLNLLNPMYYFVTIFRDSIIFSNFSENFIILGMIFFSILFFLAGIIIFYNLKDKIAEKI
jgi:ABC-type polysaccharide/polyol phosphate export permease